MSNGAIEVLKDGQFNHRLLSELICHKDFQRLMLDAEIYVDRIADMRINDMNAVLEAVRQMVLAKREDSANDLYLRTMELAQVSEEEYFGHVVADDLTVILRDIREAHKTDSTTADEPSAAAQAQQQLQTAMNFEGSSDEKKVRAFLATFGIDYDAITKEQFITLIEILRLSKYMKIPISRRGRASMTHGKGKRKRNSFKSLSYEHLSQSQQDQYDSQRIEEHEHRHGPADNRVQPQVGDQKGQDTEDHRPDMIGRSSGKYFHKGFSAAGDQPDRSLQTCHSHCYRQDHSACTAEIMFRNLCQRLPAIGRSFESSSALSPDYGHQNVDQAHEKRTEYASLHRIFCYFSRLLHAKPPDHIYHNNAESQSGQILLPARYCCLPAAP